jgi:hypothetical protein
MSDLVWQALIAGVVTIALAWIGTRKLNSIQKTGETVHTLVNSNMGTQLKLNAISLRRLATITNNPVDVDAAMLAEKLLKEHEAKQAVVDASAAKGA